MDRVLEHLSVVSIPTLIMGLFCALGAFCLIPLRHRLEVGLALMAFTLTLGSLGEIGPAASIAKVSANPVLLFVAGLAIAHPGGRRKIPFICWGYVALAAWTLVCIDGAADFSFALVLRVQWIVMTISAVLVSSTIVSEACLRRVLRGLFIGMCLSCALTLMALVEDPYAAFRSGFGRYMPYGCNPNQIGITYGLTAGLGLYFSMTAKSPLTKGVFVALTALAVGQSMLTVSRGSFMVLAITSFPSFLLVIRRPIFALFSIALVLVMGYYIIGVAEDAAFDRLDRGLISRTDTTQEVLNEVELRPWLGLAFTHDLVVYDSDLNAHNAYVAMLYLGGLVLMIPQLAIQFWGHWQILRVWRKRHQLSFNPLTISLLLSISVALLLQGMINDMAYYPTYTWAFLNVFVGCVSISLGRVAQRSKTPAWRINSNRTLPRLASSRIAPA
jgi:hypothetical protein